MVHFSQSKKTKYIVDNKGMPEKKLNNNNAKILNNTKMNRNKNSKNRMINSKIKLKRKRKKRQNIYLKIPSKNSFRKIIKTKKYLTKITDYTKMNAVYLIHK